MTSSNKKTTNVATAAAAATETHPPAGYEEGVQELEALVAEMELGQMPLDTLLSSYERGVQLLQFCRDKLTVLEQQVQVLEKDGLKPWNGES